MLRVRGYKSRVLSHIQLPFISLLRASLRYAPTGDTCVGVSRDVTRRGLSSRSLCFLIVDVCVRFRQKQLFLLGILTSAPACALDELLDSPSFLQIVPPSFSSTQLNY
jgi:hypothetical protein